LFVREVETKQIAGRRTAAGIAFDLNRITLIDLSQGTIGLKRRCQQRRTHLHSV
jgi:hypothetical protein